jgi:hypothetical protein
MAVASYFFLDFFGGIRGITTNLKQPPTTEVLTPKRAQAIQTLTTAQTELQNFSQFTFLDKAVFDDNCVKGTNDWKRQDGYAYTCDYKTIAVYGFNGDFKMKLLDFEIFLKNHGWSWPISDDCQTCEISSLIRNYYPDVEAGTRTIFNLPEPSLLNKEFSEGTVTVAINYAEREKLSELITDLSMRRDDIQTYSPEDFVGFSKRLINRGGNYQYVITLILTKNYYTD